MGTMLTAYELFKLGHDTKDIAHILRISEAAALKEVSSQRAAIRFLLSPYHHPAASFYKGRYQYQRRA